MTLGSADRIDLPGDEKKRRTKPVRVLIVEDEAFYAANLVARLEDWGFQVMGQATNGTEAIIKALRQKPDLIVMDIKLPGGNDGIEVAEMILAKMDVPLIFLTAYIDPKTLQRAARTRAADLVSKTASDRELRDALERALEKYSEK